MSCPTPRPCGVASTCLRRAVAEVGSVALAALRGDSRRRDPSVCLGRTKDPTRKARSISYGLEKIAAPSLQSDMPYYCWFGLDPSALGRVLQISVKFFFLYWKF